MQQACFHKERRRDGRRGRGRILINGSLRQASMASGGFAAPLCKNNSDLQAPPGRCAWGAWGCVMGAQICVICGCIFSFSPQSTQRAQRFEVCDSLILGGAGGMMR